MSLPIEKCIQTPSRGRTASRGSLETPSLSRSCRDTPDSQLSIESQASYNFWDADPQSRDDRSSTPVTPPSPGDYQTKTRLSILQSPCLKKSRSDSQLLTHASRVSESDAGRKSPHVKVERDENRTGWLFGEYARLYQDGLPKNLEAPNRPCPTDWLGSVEADFSGSGKENKIPEPLIWSKDYRFNVDFSRQTTPLRKADPKVLDSDRTTSFAVGNRQISRTRFERTDSGQNDSPIPSPSKDSHPHKAEVNQLVTSSETDLSESRSISAEGGFGRVQQQSDSSVQYHGRAIYQQTNETSHEVRESEFSTRLSARTTVSSSTLARILPFNIQERLKDDPHRCVASLTRKPDQRCSKKAHGPLGTVTLSLDGLSHNDARSNHGKALQYVEDLVASALCKGSHRKVATHQLETWRVSLDRLSRKLGDSQPQGGCPAAEMTAFTVWVQVLSGAVLSGTKTHQESANRVVFSNETTQLAPKTEISIADTSSEVTETRKLTSLTADSATTTETAQNQGRTKLQYFQNFQLYQPKSTSHISVHEALHRALTKPLHPRELASGHIYIYWFPGNFGYLKIGITKRDDINKRLEEWKRQCKHEAESHNVEDMPRRLAVPHVYRVEALVHAELKDIRYKEVGCKGCGKTHIEWFRIQPKHAASVVKKWSDWIMERPYEEGSQWKLKANLGGDDIKKLCEPLELIAPEPVSRRSPRINAGKRRSPRINARK